MAIIAPIALFALNLDAYTLYLADLLSGRGVYDDSFQYIPSYMTREGAPIFADDPIVAYFRTAHAPQGYDFLYSFLGQYYDIRQVSVGVGLVLFAAMLFFMFKTGQHIAGLPGALCAVFIVVASEYIARSVFAGWPRSFARPLLAATLYGLTSGRIGVTAGATVLGALFYYQVALISGLSLLIYCLIPQHYRAVTARVTHRRNFGLLIASGLAALVLISASIMRPHEYGPVISPAQYSNFPESGPTGRLWSEFGSPMREAATVSLRTLSFDTARKTSLQGQSGLGAAASHIAEALSHFKALIAAVAAGVMLFALIIFPAKALVGSLSVVVASAVLYLLAWILFPALFFPGRFFVAVPLVTVLIMTWFLANAFKWIRPSGGKIAQAGFMILAVAAALVGTGRPQWDGLVTHGQADNAVYGYLGGLPEDALIAGWPGGGPFLDAVPYRSQRRVLLSFETHQVFREGYVRMMRDRMETLIDAMVAGDPAAFRRLHDSFGVTHIVVNETVLEGGDLNYFEPFQTMLDGIADQTTGLRLLRSEAVGPIVFETEGRFVVELTDGYTQNTLTPAVPAEQ